MAGRDCVVGDLYRVPDVSAAPRHLVPCQSGAQVQAVTRCPPTRTSDRLGSDGCKRCKARNAATASPARWNPRSRIEERSATCDDSCDVRDHALRADRVGGPGRRTPRLYVNLYGQASRYSGEAKLGGAQSDGQWFDVVDDFGIDDSQGARGIDGFVTIHRSKSLFGYANWRHSGIETLEDLLIFNDSVLLPGNKYETKQRMRRAHLLYGYDFQAGPLTLGPVVGAQAVQARFEVRNVSGGCCDDDETVSRVAPALGLSLGLHPHERLAIHGLYARGSYHLDDEQTTLMQAALAIDWLFLKRFGVTAGYRYDRSHATSDEFGGDSISVRKQGPFFGLTVHF